jgi:hypothetical protein
MRPGGCIPPAVFDRYLARVRAYARLSPGLPGGSARLRQPECPGHAARSLVAYLELRRHFGLLDGVKALCPGKFFCS